MKFHDRLLIRTPDKPNGRWYYVHMLSTTHVWLYSRKPNFSNNNGYGGKVLIADVAPNILKHERA